MQWISGGDDVAPLTALPRLDLDTLAGCGISFPQYQRGFVMRLIIVFALVAVLGGCTTTVVLRHPQTGETVKCGPYRPSVAGAAREARCLDDYQRQGFERVPE